MMKESLVVRYDGPALAGHRMDVADLAPALLGLSELFKIANRKFNGDAAAVKVLIGADIEQKCFQFNADIVQTLWQQAQTIMGHQEVKSAKELAEWIGLIIGGSIGGGGIYGLFRLLKALGNSPLPDGRFVAHDGRDCVQISINGNNNTILTYRETYEMAKDESVVANAKRVIEPVTRPGYERLDFEHAGLIEQVSREDAERIVGFAPPSDEESDLGEPQTITAFVKVYAPVYDTKADRWRFVFNGGHPYIDISGTDIAQKAIERGGALINDSYKVEMQIQQTKTADGGLSARYKINKVIEFFPASIPRQRPLIRDDSEDRGRR